MQPDNIRPVAKIPSFAFSDIIYFHSKDLAVTACALKPTIPLIPLWSKSATIPAFRVFSRAAGGGLWLFCRNFCGFRLILGQRLPWCRIRATLAPPVGHKCERTVNLIVMMHLAESR